MTATNTNKFLLIGPYRLISPMPRDLLYSASHGVFNVLDSFRATEVGLHGFADKVAELSEERADELRKLIGEMDKISDVARKAVDLLIDARKRYSDLLERMNASVEAPL